MNLRQLAKDKPCQIRSLVCNRNPETTVLAHYRLIGVSGMGMKSPDLLGAWACADCHALVDGRTGKLSKPDRDLLLLQGMARTQAELVRMGLLKW